MSFIGLLLLLTISLERYFSRNRLHTCGSTIGWARLVSFFTSNVLRQPSRKRTCKGLYPHLKQAAATTIQHRWWRIISTFHSCFNGRNMGLGKKLLGSVKQISSEFYIKVSNESMRIHRKIEMRSFFINFIWVQLLFMITVSMWNFCDDSLLKHMW